MITPRPLPARAHLQALAIFAGVSLLICFPVLSDPVHTALGYSGNDIWNHLWGYWWVNQEILSGHLPIHTDLLDWPTGGSLWFIDAFDVVLTLPVQWVAGPIAAYNAAIFLNLVLCGLGAYVLGRQVSGSWAGGVLAGIAYMTTPHLLGQIYNGISETVAAGWLPLAVWMMREIFLEPTWKKGFVAGILVGLTSLASWYYGLFAGMILLGLLLREGMRTIEGIFSRRRRRARSDWAGLFVAGISGTVGLGLLSALPFYWFSQSMSATDALVTRDPGFVWMTLLMHNMTDLVTLVRPGKFYSPDLKAAFGEDLLVIVYMGASLWIPAVWTLFSTMRHRAESWVLLWGGFLLLSLGPFLYVAGDYVHVGGGWLPLPFLALYQWFPMFSRISHAYRFAMGTSLALSVLVALAVRASPWGAGKTAVLLGVLRVTEAFLGSPAVWPLPVSDVKIPAIYTQLTGGAVLDLPITEPVLARSSVLIYQLVHQQPVPFGLNDPVPTYLHLNHYTQFIIGLERRLITFLPPDLPLLDLAAGQEDLRLRGCKWIVVHRDRYTDDQASRVIRFLDLTATVFGEEGDVRVYELGD